VFFACLNSIPSKNEQIKNDEQDYDWFSKLFDAKDIFIKEILKSKHCNSDVIRNLIETKHDSYVKKINNK
jgi:ATP-dependent protease ClpP protease subunit